MRGIPAHAQERLCDNSYEDCRAPLIQLIRNEKVGIDVSYWFMTDWYYSSTLIAKWRDERVPIRVILDTQADVNYPASKTIRTNLANAGIPIRDCISSSGINHWKAMIFAGQGKVQFSAANYSEGSFSPTTPYLGYVDEAIYFTDDAPIVQSFMRKFDDHWTDTTAFANLANISGPLVRNYPTYPVHPDMNFVPGQNFEERLRSQVMLENEGIDAVIFRITSGMIPDALIARRSAGVPVRLITEERQYRNTSYFWDSYNIDRMYMAGIQIKIKDNVTEQDMHQKSMILHSRGLATSGAGPMAVFGSSNWTSSSAARQREHNYFTRKPWMVDWFIDQFERKWNNRRADGTPIGSNVYIPFTPLLPETAVYLAPANDALGQTATVTLRWEGGWWAHKYDIYFGANSNPPLAVEDFMPGSATAGVRSTKESYAFSGLAPATTYYWKIVSKTMADRRREGPLHRFTTAGDIPSPVGTGAHVLEDAYVRAGAFAASNFGTAAELIVKFSADTGYVREAYLKVDVSAVSSSDRVVLRMFGALSDSRASSVTTAVHGSSSIDWSENTVTWNTRLPLDSAPVGTITVSGTSPTWYEVDVTTYVQARRSAGASVVTLGLSNHQDTLPYVTFSATEASSTRPEVIVSGNDGPRIVADSYVRSGPYASTSFGTASELIAKLSADTRYGREAVLRLEFGTVQVGDSVTLRLYGRLSDARTPTVTIEVFGSADTTWSESSITWHNRPAADTDRLAAIVVNSTASQWYEVDLTEYVQSRRAGGAAAATLVLRGAEDTLPYASFSSRETPQQPLLVVVSGG